MYQSGRLSLCTPIAAHDVHNRGPLHMLIKAARCTMLFQAVARYILHNCGLLHELVKTTRDPMLLQAVARCTLHIGDPLHTMSDEWIIDHVFRAILVGLIRRGNLSHRAFRTPDGGGGEAA
jgi:hypothetical protein